MTLDGVCDLHIKDGTERSSDWQGVVVGKEKEKLPTLAGSVSHMSGTLHLIWLLSSLERVLLESPVASMWLNSRRIF